jgi:regulator of RNase E activity RraA
MGASCAFVLPWQCEKTTEGSTAMATIEERPIIGFRAFRRKQAVPSELIQRFGGIPTTNVVDAMGRTGAMDYGIKPIDREMRLLGPALTVRVRPTDNLIIYAAMKMASPDDVLVIATGNFTLTSTWGDLTSYMARGLGIAGVVTDGLCRDVAGIRDAGLPVFARGAVPNSPFKDGQGEINIPVSVGGVVVNPGDIIIGDEDGVVVVPQADAQEVRDGSLAVVEREKATMAGFAEGRFIPSYVDAELENKGFRIVDD